MSDGAFGCQAPVKQPRQVVVAQAPAGEAAGGQVLGERLCAQRQFLPGLFPSLGDVVRPSFAEQGCDPSTSSRSL